MGERTFEGMREAEPSKRLRAENKPQEEMRWEKEHNITKCNITKCKNVRDQKIKFFEHMSD